MAIARTGKTNKKLVLAGLLLGLIFAELDETVVATAMPTIIRELHGMALYGWVAGIYMLSVTMFMPIIGKLADLYGRKRVYIVCMALFVCGSMMCGTASSMAGLLTGRAIQGIGAGGLMPLALVIIGDAYPLEQRARIQALFGPLLILPQLLGPTVGGYIVGQFDWHWIFLINIPIGLIAAAMIAAGMRETRGTGRRSIDWAGATLLAAGLLLLLLAPVLIDTQGYSWTSPAVLGLLAMSALLLSVFVRVERKAEQPMIPPSLFRNRNVVVIYSLVFLLMLSVMGGIAAFPFYAQNVMGLAPTASGYLMLAFAGATIPASVLVGFLVTRVVYRNVFVAACLLPLAGFALLSRIGVGTGVLYVVAAFIVLGFGVGALFGANNLIVQESVGKEESGVAISSVQLFQSLGATIGLSVFGSVLGSRIGRGVEQMGARLPEGSGEAIAAGGIPDGMSAELVDGVRAIFAEAFQELFLLSLLFGAVAFIVAWFLKKEVLAKREPNVRADAAASDC
ncbi:MFS transporter [Cohnella sp.]|uniref:MFS transporter n=1 Tax=Cohnella sp. TaxID=1883426 RepID=UPI003567ADC1